jgi:hypothetical protein
MKIIILTTSSEYTLGSNYKFLMKSIAKLSLPVRSYSEISHIILMVKNTIYDFFVNNTKLIQKQE